MRRRPFGPEAWIVDELDDATAWAETLRRSASAGAAATSGIVEIVPTATTVVVRCASRHVASAVGPRLDELTPVATDTTRPALVTIDVVYDGDDLAEVAATVGCSIEDLIELHGRPEYVVAFCGFSPGFGYLTGLDDRLVLPRRQRPRTSVPAGSVAVAAGYTAVYPASSPGGWHLLGRTDRVVWDVDRDPPALLAPGTPVRFRRVRP
jgi:KipI family sensor histidine kinase inhibitor